MLLLIIMAESNASVALTHGKIYAGSYLDARSTEWAIQREIRREEQQYEEHRGRCHLRSAGGDTAPVEWNPSDRLVSPRECGTPTCKWTGIPENPLQCPECMTFSTWRNYLHRGRHGRRGQWPGRRTVSAAAAPTPSRYVDVNNVPPWNDGNGDPYQR